MTKQYPEGSISHTTLQELRDLQDDEDPHFVVNILTSFLDSVGQRMEKLSRAIERGSAPSVGEEAHAIKSSCFNIGAMKMGDLCNELESLEKVGSLENANGLFERLQAEHVLVKKEILSLPEFQKNMQNAA